MAIKNFDTDVYEKFRIDGGEFSCNLDLSDLSHTDDIENWEFIKPNLQSGFELPPTSVLNGAQIYEIRRYADAWANVVLTVYNAGGRITYRKLPSGEYCADCSIPARKK